LRRYERELKKLRNDLEVKGKNVVDKRQLLQLEDERRRAEEVPLMLSNAACTSI
jgi:kinesin family protein 3/17